MGRFPSSNPYGDAAGPPETSVHAHKQETDPHPQYAADGEVTALDGRLDVIEADYLFPGYGTAANLADVTKAAEAAGALTTVARADHKHDVSTAAASTQAFGDAAAEGTATSLARSDHKHGMPANPFPGYGTTTQLANVTKAAEDAGVSLLVARGDHKHDVTTATASTQAFADAAAEGTATSLARSDHKHGMPSFAAPVALTGSAVSAGSAATAARSDHVHPMPKKRYRCTANTAVSTTATAAITGFPTHSLTAGKVYQIDAYLLYTTAAATTGPRPALVASGGLTATDFLFVGANRASTTVMESTNAVALDDVLAFSGGITGVNVVLTASATIKVNVAGSIQLQMGSEVAASAITTQAGSWMTVEEVSE